MIEVGQIRVAKSQLLVQGPEQRRAALHPQPLPLFNSQLPCARFHREQSIHRRHNLRRRDIHEAQLQDFDKRSPRLRPASRAHDLFDLEWKCLLYA